MSLEEGRITDDSLEQLRSAIGQEYDVVAPFNEYATIDTIRHFVHGFGDTNPLFTDCLYAAETKGGTVIAPPTFLFTTMGAGGRLGLPGVHGFWGGVEFKWYLPIRAGDRIKGRAALTAVSPKRSNFAGRAIYQEWTFTFRNQHEEMIARVVQWALRTERGMAKERAKYASLRLARYTDRDIRAIEADYDKEEVRGSVPRLWRDVSGGEDMGIVVKGPLTTTDNVAWKIGWGFYPFTFAHGIAYRYRRDHPGIIVKNEFGAPDVPERVHWDAKLARRVGAPGSFDTGPQRASWLCQVVTNWMGDDGFIRRLRCEARRLNLVGDTTWCTGRITRKYVEAEEHLVDCDLQTTDQRGETSMVGSATIALPN